MTELFDAQSQVQTAREAATAAVFFYLQKLMEVQRAVGGFDVLMSLSEFKDFKTDLTRTVFSKETDCRKHD
jgi:hypothetical protein